MATIQDRLRETCAGKGAVASADMELHDKAADKLDTQEALIAEADKLIDELLDYASDTTTYSGELTKRIVEWTGNARRKPNDQ